MEAQSLKSLGIALLVTVLVGIAYAANPIATVPGVVTDENGVALEGVAIELQRGIADESAHLHQPVGPRVDGGEHNVVLTALILYLPVHFGE